MADQDGIDPRHDPIFQRGYDPAVHGAPATEGSGATRRSRSRRDADLDLFAPPSAPRPERAASRAVGSPAAVAPSAAGADHGDTVGERPARVGAPPSGERVAQSPDPLLFLTSSFGAGDDDGDDDGDGPDERHRAPREEAPVDTAAPWRNPYLLGLVIGGAVLAIAGFQMFRSALETIYVDFAQNGFIFGGSGTGAEEEPDPAGVLVSMQLGWSLGPLLLLIGLAAILAVVVFVAVRWRPVRTAGGGEAGRGASAPDTEERS